MAEASAGTARAPPPGSQGREQRPGGVPKREGALGRGWRGCANAGGVTEAASSGGRQQT